MLELEHDDGFIRVRASGAISVDEMEEHFRELEGLAHQTQGPVGAVIDARAVELRELHSEHRDCAVAALRRMRPLIAHRYVAQAIVIDSVFGRLMVGMLHLFVRPAKQTRSFSDPAAAEAWVRNHLE